jgi:hypothetical protein
MNHISTSVVVIMIAAIALIIIKTVHFLIAINRKRILSWFYFNKFSINNSRDPQSAKAKKLQNSFTLMLVFTSLAALIMLFLTS